MAKPNPALRFAERINAHDNDGLVELMTPDFTFVDSLGDRFVRPAVENGWSQYFEMVPDYWIRVDRSITEGDTTILIGSAGGTYASKGAPKRSENRWETPAVWTARIRGTKVAEWRIYSDNEPIRATMRKVNGRSD